MYSKPLRFIYASTYYIHIGIVGEIYNITKYGLLPDFKDNWSWCKYIYEVACIHYPLVFVVFCLVVADVMVKNCKRFAPNTIQLNNDSSYGMEILYTSTQVLPYVTSIFGEQSLGVKGVIIVMLITMFFLTSHGSFNLTLMFLGYNQYRVNAASSTYWMISKRRISNFTSSEEIHKLQDNVVIRYE